MSLLAAAGLGLLIGAVLGALGGGGAILTVPALVYLLGQTPQDATTSSLIIVGLTAVVGAIGHARSGQVRWRTGTAFGVAGIAAAVAGTAANRHVDPQVLLLGFAALMTVAAIGMLARSRHEPDHQDPPPQPPAPAGHRGAGTAQLTRPAPAPARARTMTAVKIVVAGVAVGFLTGFLGVGGGFIIVPALVLVLGLPMPIAVGTSLLIIAINSGASLAARSGTAHFDWQIIIPFTLAAMAASLAGKKIADRLPQTVTTRAFAVLILAVAAYTAGHTLLAT
ncbi:UPF0721 transmembrane protein [Actinoplanes italicus]|uniref:Probable membrane transporter protein n=1 Tax=Actinoplanes italicus TaxID=113567 RepID=A0A2T0KPD2_9ACTN|nr:sulfite exporter TauE/SafE family protein [Actinoplanes italicus]PRX25596.1 hypothetical protein CLV67_101313 [Actinoplanes italicus]GIE28959.1 UPF0721 transmembrane protein [Actinoplanes italicus]